MKAVDKEASKENKTIASKGFKFILSVLFVFLFESSLKLQKKSKTKAKKHTPKKEW